MKIKKALRNSQQADYRIFKMTHQGAHSSSTTLGEVGGGGGTPYDGLYGEASPRGVSFFRLQVDERVGISIVKYTKG